MNKPFPHLAQLRQCASRLRREAVQIQHAITARLLAEGPVSAEEMRMCASAAHFAASAHAFYLHELERCNSEVLATVDRLAAPSAARRDTDRRLVRLARAEN